MNRGFIKYINVDETITYNQTDLYQNNTAQLDTLSEENKFKLEAEQLLKSLNIQTANTSNKLKYK